MSNFPDFLTKQFLNWQAKQGKRKSLIDFAIFLGISRPLLSMWMNGSRRPGSENIKLLAEIFGIEVFDALDLPRPDPDLHYLQAHWVNLPPEKRKEMREQAEAYVTKKKDK